MGSPGPSRCTRRPTGACWWARVPSLGRHGQPPAGQTDYHGAKYQFLFNDRDRYQDPAAGWVEESANRAASRLVRRDHFTWHDASWNRPGWESLIVYQLHAARFTNRHSGEVPLRRVAREIDSAGGYLRRLGAAAHRAETACPRPEGF